MINTILFDLDGTLLSIDTDLFINNYFGYIADHLKDYFTQEEVVRLFWQSTKKVIGSNDGSKTNEQVFFDSFFSEVDVDASELIPILNDFYETKFSLLQHIAESKKEMIEAINILKDKGYELVIATNPIFPEAAIKQRVAWANLDENDFKHITTFEGSHYTKPNINYYHEVLHKIDKKAENCLMVGNHIDEDMISNTIGIDTYLITNHVMGDETNKANVKYEGNYTDFLKFVNDLKTV